MINRGEFFDSVGRIVKRFPHYFILAAASISVLAAIQYWVLEYMPVWNNAKISTNKKRVIQFSTSRDTRLAVIERIETFQRQQTPVGLNVTLIDLADGSLKNIYTGNGVLIGAMSPCGNWLATASATGTVTIGAVADECQAQSQIHLDICIEDLFWSPDSETLLARAEELVILVNRRSGNVVIQLPIESSSLVAMSAMANCFLACSSGKYRIFECQSASVIRDLPIDSSSRSLALSDDMSFAAYLVGTTLTMVDLMADKILWRREFSIPLHLNQPIAFVDDNQCLAVMSSESNGFGDYNIHIVEVIGRREVFKSRIQQPLIAGVHFATDESIWFWSVNGTISKWDMPSKLDDVKQVVSLKQPREIRMALE